jgi:hypothetical protein
MSWIPRRRRTLYTRSSLMLHMYFSPIDEAGAANEWHHFDLLRFWPSLKYMEITKNYTAHKIVLELRFAHTVFKEQLYSICIQQVQ